MSTDIMMEREYRRFGRGHMLGWLPFGGLLLSSTLGTLYALSMLLG